LPSDVTPGDIEMHVRTWHFSVWYMDHV